MEPGIGIGEAKTSLRTQIREALRRLTPAEREKQSTQACTRLTSQPLFQQAQAILFFSPLSDEPDIWPLAMDARGAGKTVALPRYSAETGLYAACEVADLEQDVEPGRFGIREPSVRCADLKLNRLDLILVPGVAFDLLGHRLGRGQGFYDRLLKTVHGTTCGVGFNEQLLREIPVAPHDVRVNCILTPARWIEPQA